MTSRIRFKLKNNRGFTFVEILAVVAIMGILSGIAIVSVSKYRQKQIQNNYDAIAFSSYNAMESYIMKNGDTERITIKELFNKDFISNISDPLNNGKNCVGAVISNSNDGKLKSNNYDVRLCCSEYKKEYHFPNKDNRKPDDIDDCRLVDSCKHGESFQYDENGEIIGCVESKYNIRYEDAGEVSTPNSAKYSDDVAVSNPTKKVTLHFNNEVGATVEGNKVSEDLFYPFLGWTSSELDENASANGISWNGSVPVKDATFKNLRSGDDDLVTLKGNWGALSYTMPTASKNGYTCKWIDDEGNSVPSGSIYNKFTDSDEYNFSLNCSYNSCVNTKTVLTKEDKCNIYCGTSSTALYKYYNIVDSVTGQVCGTTKTKITCTNKPCKLKFYMGDYKSGTPRSNCKVNNNVKLFAGRGTATINRFSNHPYWVIENYKQYDCTCTRNKTTGVISNAVSSATSNHKSVVVYQNNNNGSVACNTFSNSFVLVSCEFGDHDGPVDTYLDGTGKHNTTLYAAGNDYKFFHGYWWFYGKAPAGKNTPYLRTKWTHGGETTLDGSGLDPSFDKNIRATGSAANACKSYCNSYYTS